MRVSDGTDELFTFRPKRHTYPEFVFGGVAYSISVVGLFPIHKTIFFQQLDGISWLEAINRLRNEGYRLVYRGVLPPLLQRASSGAIMFGVQNKAEDLLWSYPSTSKNPFINKFISSVFAGCVETVLIPFERVQTLLQNKEYFNQYKHTFHALATIKSEYGMKELYRGFTPIIYRNSTANALYFCGHKWLSSLRVRRNNETAIERGLWNFVFGGLLGGFIGVVTFPLNVAKTRMQTSVGGSFLGLRTTFVALVGNDVGKPNLLRLYRGMPANFMRSILSWGLITMSYQYLMEIYFGLQ